MRYQTVIRATQTLDNLNKKIIKPFDIFSTSEQLNFFSYFKNAKLMKFCLTDYIFSFRCATRYRSVIWYTFMHPFSFIMKTFFHFMSRKKLQYSDLDLREIYKHVQRSHA